MYSAEQFCIPQHYRDDLESIIIPHGMVLDRCVARVLLLLPWRASAVAAVAG